MRKLLTKGYEHDGLRIRPRQHERARSRLTGSRADGCRLRQQPTISRLRRTILAGLLALPLSAQAQPMFYPQTGQNPVERAETLSRALKAEREERERAEVQCLKPNGQPEPCELRQQPMPRLSRWLVLPPPEYDKPFPGKLQEIRVPPETMRAICPKTPLPLTLACTYPTHDQSQCLIIMVSDEIIRVAGWSPEIVRRHEVGHCNGFRAIIVARGL